MHILIFQYPPELQSVHNVLQHSQHFLRGDGHHLIKRGSRASDTSSAYSGSDMMQSSLGDDENVDLSGLVETLVDSDDEEGYVESPDVSREYFALFLLSDPLVYASKIDKTPMVEPSNTLNPEFQLFEI